MSQLGQFLDNLVQREKQINDAGKSADFFVKANPQALDEMGMHEDQWKNLGARDKMNAVQGYVSGKATQRATQEANAQVQLRTAEAAKAQNEVDANSGFPDFARFLNEEMSGAPTWPPPGQADWNGFLQGKGPVQMPGTATGTAQPGTPPPMSQAVLRALARVQSLNPRTAAAIASKVLPAMVQNTMEDNPVTFTQDPKTGKRFASKGKVLMDSGVDPEIAAQALSGGAVPMKDEAGNVISYNMPIGGGKFKPQAVKDLTEAQKQNLILQHQKEQDSLLGQLQLSGGNTNTMAAINDRIGQHQSAIDVLKSKGKALSAPTATTPPKITSQTQFDALPSGTVYLNKAGKSFRKP